MLGQVELSLQLSDPQIAALRIALYYAFHTDRCMQAHNLQCVLLLVCLSMARGCALYCASWPGNYALSLNHACMHCGKQLATGRCNF